MHNSFHIPPQGAHIHLMGICGVGMSSLAGMLKEKGYTITGSDHNIYPPMSTFLENLSIPVKKGYSPSNLYPPPDLVIVGNVITRDNPEAAALLQHGLPYVSMPQALRRFAMDKKRSIAIAGTHGKTTASALIAWILEIADMKPSFMIGGIAKNFGTNFKLGTGSYFVIEGDEYDTAFFDKRPKFLHYDPYITVITGIEFDHADIYKGIEEIKDAFRSLIEMIPAEGLLCANRDDPVILDEMNRVKCPLLTYAIKREADLCVRDIIVSTNETEFTVLQGGKEYLRVATELYGDHNIYNILAALSVAFHLHIEPEIIVKAIKTFKGIKRRLETIGNYGDILVIDDFAHHPTAVRETTRAVKNRYQDRRLVAVFEPRSNTSRRNIFQDAYAASFTSADVVILPVPPKMETIPPRERFSSTKLKADLIKQDIQALYFPNNDDLLDGLLALIRPGDVMLIMSNGPFDNLQERLIQRLKENK
ncbi:MAG: UDP-N-acetylmuramate:L-alanyl-gamma-D-glutamyl-meso-diaminopimelate ligase [Proteobacteria bacterium]|nr:UDP-N-acetylmuramate:L-alanyl-gamma-D-glutamyl-meso-diaminopimelate ligase [Pseudomonadota bacterium]